MEINERLEFERSIQSMSDRQVLEFTARQVYTMQLLCPIHEDRLVKLENLDRNGKKVIGISGGIGGIIAGIIIAVVNYFTGRS